jgi:hypothetical protein
VSYYVTTVTGELTPDPGSKLARMKPKDDAGLAEWAKEHLVYEVDTMIYALERLEGESTGRPANVAIAAFGTSARCLRDFLWGKPNPRFDNDAFAFHFSDEWKGRRGGVPPNLAEVDDRGRFGKEIFHLTYDRISGVNPRKEWPCGHIAVEIGQALKLFAELARSDSLDDETRERLKLVAVPGADEDSNSVDLVGRLSLTSLAEVTGATTMTPAQHHGGTINPRNLNIGGQ